MTAVSSTRWRGWHLAAGGAALAVSLQLWGFTVSPARRSRPGFHLPTNSNTPWDLPFR